MIMRRCIIKYYLWSIILTLSFLFLSSCASFGPTKPNPVFQGPYPARYYELAQKNSLLVEELGKLPEIQDGISALEAFALEKVVEIYNEIPNEFDDAFKQMYQVGFPEVRKYCSPLQALFWLVEDGRLEECRKILNTYYLDDLLTSAYDFRINLSMEQLTKIINTLPQEEQQLYDGVTNRNSANNITLTLFKHSPGCFSRESKKLIKNAKSFLKWEDFKTVVERLNSPELINYYERMNFSYVPYGQRQITADHVFRYKKGCCQDFTAFSVYCLKKAGYNAKAITVISPSGGHRNHVVCEYKDKDGQEYILDNSCRGCGSGKGITEKEIYIKSFRQVGVGYW